MSIIVAGQPSALLEEQVTRDAANMRRSARQPATVSPEIGATALCHSTTEAGYHENFLRLLRYRDAVDTLDFDIPCRPGRIGRYIQLMKRYLWKLLRYQHDRITFRQNMINGLFTQALENELLLRRRETEELRARVAALEARSGKPPTCQTENHA
jgi:hypothetical protein